MNTQPLPRYTFSHYRRQCCKCSQWRTTRGGRMRKVRPVSRGAVTEFTCRECL